MIPYFEIYTFLPSILKIIHFADDSGADMLLNGLLPIGMQVFGLQLTMMALAALLVVGMAVSIAWVRKCGICVERLRQGLAAA